MRLIDADALKKEAYPFPCAIGTEYAVTLRRINEVPTVDAEPVRHGTWEMCRKTLKTDFATLTGTYPTCSLCGHVEFGVDKSTPYCPGCGAKMGEEDMKDGKTDRSRL